ncbi:NUDIX hydrolase [Wenzhouxiangella marina]|uniref:GDP-mannose pyrophosphatase n=1 Tax=Wenzhouxiangella marina TaxID=1579979 RepID=A0A0K0XT28_9GAMM|nr:NUDIX hydrolase [Wenzhouxiangella marina]AKS40777.1 DNA mismatch repair protein MutT [Wenzhouxiangella marina]MBB6087650.1 ADP-ribose pyrophosphatase [Wenzhouxiangella marina]
MLPEADIEELHRGAYLSLCSRKHWEFVHRQHPVVVLVAWTPARELLLVEQYREPIAARTIELPAGLVGDEVGSEDEALLDAANRELEEETGWRAGRLTELMRCPTSAGMSDEMAVFLHAESLEQVGPGGGTGSEDITVHAIPERDIDAWLQAQRREGKQLDPKIYAALYWTGSR